MATLVNIMAKTPAAVQIWGFHDPCNVGDVAAALNTIASSLSGDGHTIHVMSGTHGYCSGQVGAVAARTEIRGGGPRRWRRQDQDQKPVAIAVH